MMFSKSAYPLTEKTVWITGASSGIGLQLSRDLASKNNLIIASGRNTSALEQLQQQFPNNIVVLSFDLSNDAHWASLPSRFRDFTDTLDGVIAAAGICEYLDDPLTGQAIYRRVFEVNFFAMIRTLSIAVPLLKKSESQAFFAGVSSMAAQAPFTRTQAYGASKAACEYWLGCQRIDLEPQGIHVITISPGFVDTPLTRQNDFPMPTLISVEEASDIICTGIAQNRKSIVFPKRLLWMLRIYRWFPGLWFGPIARKMRRAQDI
ncbi:SDR family oxidoreductase [Sessilibacter sp. MAH1]